MINDDERTLVLGFGDEDNAVIRAVGPSWERGGAFRRIVRFVLRATCAALVVRGIPLSIPRIETDNITELMAVLVVVIACRTVVGLLSSVRPPAGAHLVSAAEEPALHGVLDELWERAQLRWRPRLAVREREDRNAYASFGLITVDRSLLDAGDPDELRATLAHELGHVALHHPTYASVRQALLTASLAAAWYAWMGLWDEWSLAQTAILAMVAAGVFVALRLLNRALDRRQELAADLWGAAVAGAPLRAAHLGFRSPDFGPYPGPTWAMVCGRLFGAIERLTSTHPTAETRLARLRIVEACLRGQTISTQCASASAQHVGVRSEPVGPSLELELKCQD
jgi:Zn-dependent protease with chaperone function